MEIIWSDVILIISLVLANITALVVSWNKTLIKIKEIEVKLQQHITWGETEQVKNELKFDKINEDIKTNQELINKKLDTIIEKFNNFQIYCEKNFTRK